MIYPFALSQSSPVEEGPPGGDLSGFLTSDDDGGPTYAFTDISGTGTLLSALDEADDEQTDITLAGDWVFPFFGTDYTTFWVTSNGCVVLAFDDNARFVDNEEESFPHEFYSPNPIIAAFGHDMVMNPTSAIYWQGFSDHIVIQWTELDTFDFPGGPTGSVFTFQCILWDTGKVQFVYENMTPVDDTLDASIGLQSDDTHNGITVSDGLSTLVHSNFMVEIT